jgi:beta-glucosidase
MPAFRTRHRVRRVLARRWMLVGVAAAALAAAVTAGHARSATTPVPVTVSAAQPVYLVHAGQTAQPGLVLTTAGGVPLDRSVTVNYQTGGTLPVGSGSAQRSLPSTATPGTDYTAASGSVTFPAGTPSGTAKTFSVTTLAGHAPSEAKTINITLSTTDSAATVTDDPPTVVIDAHGFPYLDSSLPISQRVSDLMSRMSLAEKIGQMTQADRSMFTDSRS